MANKSRMTKRAFREALEDSGGDVGLIAHRLQKSRRSVYRYLEKYPDLEQMFLQEKKMGTDEIVEAARNKLFEGVLNGNERLVMFALRHYDKSGIPGAVDMDSLFSPDVVEAMRSAGIGMSDVVKEFEALVRAQKAMNDA